MGVLKKKMKICYLKLYLHLQELYCKNLRVLHAVACARTTFFKFSIQLTPKFFFLPTTNISPDACFRFFTYFLLPANCLQFSWELFLGKL